MSTVTKFEINSPSSDFTVSLGEKIGKNLRGNELIVLVSDLGGGKTTLTKGIVKGCGSNDLVSSPSFTLSNQYKAESFLINHYDFYRLNDPGVLLEGIIEDINDNEKVVIVEWPDILMNDLPDKKLVIEIKTINESERKISLNLTKDLNYLVEEVV